MIQFADESRFKLFCSFMFFMETFSYEERYSFVNAKLNSDTSYYVIY